MVWFDIDNTLYSASSKISQAMGVRIHSEPLSLSAKMCRAHHTYIDYFVGMGLSHEEAAVLHHRYYSQYGLALRGLKRHHDVGNAVQREPLYIC